MSSQKHKLQLISAGQLIPTLHYGSFAVNWWIFNNRKMPDGEKQTCVPIRLNMRVQLELHETKFIIRIVNGNNNTRPGYICESDTTGKVYLSASEAINETYKKLFNTKTRYSGPSLIGFDNEAITAELLSGIQFHPFKITIDKLSVLIIDLGDSNDNFDNIVGSGYQSSFMYKYQGNQCLYVQKKIATNNCQIEVFHKEEKIANYNGISPTAVWDKTKILMGLHYLGLIMPL